MAKTLDDVKSALVKLENGNDLYEVVSSLVNEAESAKTSFNTMNSTHNKLVGQLKALGYGGGNASTFLDELKNKVERAAELETEVADKSKKVSSAASEMALLKKSIDELKQGIAVKETALMNRKIKDKLIPLMKDKIFASELRADKLIETGRVTMTEDEKLVFKNGDELIPVEKGLDEYFKDPSNKGELKNTQQPGSGGGNPGGGIPSAKVIQRAEFSKLGAADQAKYVKEGGTLTD